MVVDYSQPPKMVNFNGANPLDWVSQVERYFFCYSVSNSLKLPLASFFIEGEAREWFRSLYGNNEFRDWDHFVDELFIRFPNRTRDASTVTEMPTITVSEQIHDRHTCETKGASSATTAVSALDTGSSNFLAIPEVGAKLLANLSEVQVLDESPQRDPSSEPSPIAPTYYFMVPLDRLDIVDEVDSSLDDGKSEEKGTFPQAISRQLNPIIPLGLGENCVNTLADKVFAKMSHNICCSQAFPAMSIRLPFYDILPRHNIVWVQHAFGLHSWIDTGQTKIAYLPGVYGGNIDKHSTGMTQAFSIIANSCIAKTFAKADCVIASRQLADASTIRFPFDPGATLSKLFMKLRKHDVMNAVPQINPGLETFPLKTKATVHRRLKYFDGPDCLVLPECPAQDLLARRMIHYEGTRPIWMNTVMRVPPFIDDSLTFYPFKDPSAMYRVNVMEIFKKFERHIDTIVPAPCVLNQFPFDPGSHLLPSYLHNASENVVAVVAIELFKSLLETDDPFCELRLPVGEFSVDFSLATFNCLQEATDAIRNTCALIKAGVVLWDIRKSLNSNLSLGGVDSALMGPQCDKIPKNFYARIDYTSIVFDPGGSIISVIGFCYGEPSGSSSSLLCVDAPIQSLYYFLIGIFEQLYLLPEFNEAKFGLVHNNDRCLLIIPFDESELGAAWEIIDLSGIAFGLLLILESSRQEFVKVTLIDFLNLTDKVVLSLIILHGKTLQLWSFDRCRKVREVRNFALLCAIQWYFSTHGLDLSKDNLDMAAQILNIVEKKSLADVETFRMAIDDSIAADNVVKTLDLWKQLNQLNPRSMETSLILCANYQDFRRTFDEHLLLYRTMLSKFQGVCGTRIAFKGFGGPTDLLLAEYWLVRMAKEVSKRLGEVSIKRNIIGEELHQWNQQVPSMTPTFFGLSFTAILMNWTLLFVEYTILVPNLEDKVLVYYFFLSLVLFSHDIVLHQNMLELENKRGYQQKFGSYSQIENFYILQYLALASTSPYLFQPQEQSGDISEHVNCISALILLYPNLEDKVLFEGGSIVVNGPEVLVASGLVDRTLRQKQPKTTSSVYIWDPGPTRIG